MHSIHIWKKRMQKSLFCTFLCFVSFVEKVWKWNERFGKLFSFFFLSLFCSFFCCTYSSFHCSIDVFSILQMKLSLQNIPDYNLFNLFCFSLIHFEANPFFWLNLKMGNEEEKKNYNNKSKSVKGCRSLRIVWLCFIQINRTFSCSSSFKLFFIFLFIVECKRKLHKTKKKLKTKKKTQILYNLFFFYFPVRLFLVFSSFFCKFCVDHFKRFWWNAFIEFLTARRQSVHSNRSFWMGFCFSLFLPSFWSLVHNETEKQLKKNRCKVCLKRIARAHTQSQPI